MIQYNIIRRDSTDDRAVASYPANPGLNTDDSFMLQRAWPTIMNRVGKVGP